MRENQQSIQDWARETLGKAKTNMRKAVRANEEMHELLTKLAIDDNDPKAVDEAADICIVLYTLVGQMGFDLDEAIDRKMAINRCRKWKLDGSGCGQHEE